MARLAQISINGWLYTGKQRAPYYVFERHDGGRLAPSVKVHCCDSESKGTKLARKLARDPKSVVRGPLSPGQARNYAWDGLDAEFDFCSRANSDMFSEMWKVEPRKTAPNSSPNKPPIKVAASILRQTKAEKNAAALAEAQAFDALERTMIDRLKAAYKRAQNSGYSRIEHDREVGRVVLEIKRTILPKQSLDAKDWYPMHLGFGINYANRCAAVEMRWDEYQIAQRWYDALVLGHTDHNEIWPVRGSGCDHVMSVMNAYKKHQEGRIHGHMQERINRPTLKQRLEDMTRRAKAAEDELAEIAANEKREAEEQAEARARAEDMRREAEAARKAGKGSAGRPHRPESKLELRMPEKDASLMAKCLEMACHHTASDTERLGALTQIKRLLADSNYSVTDLVPGVGYVVYAPDPPERGDTSKDEDEGEPIYSEDVQTMIDKLNRELEGFRAARKLAATTTMDNALRGVVVNSADLLGISVGTKMTNKIVLDSYARAILEFEYRKDSKKMVLAKKARDALLAMVEQAAERELDLID